MGFPIHSYSFEEIYLPIQQYLILDEEKDTITRIAADAIPYPVTDGNILDAVIHVILQHNNYKQPLTIAHVLKQDKRDLSGAIHILTGMHHDELLRQYRLRAITEILTTSKISTQTIATFFGYSSIHAMNRFLTDQTELTANEIRRGVNATTKIKKLPWWKIKDYSEDAQTGRTDRP